LTDLVSVSSLCFADMVSEVSEIEF
jgi:hypothetical protein